MYLLQLYFGCSLLVTNQQRRAVGLFVGQEDQQRRACQGQGPSRQVITPDEGGVCWLQTNKGEVVFWLAVCWLQTNKGESCKPTKASYKPTKATKRVTRPVKGGDF